MTTLSSGSHQTPEEGTCVMEHIALLTQQDFTDYPRCTEPAISRRAQESNDRMGYVTRQMLMRFVDRLKNARPLPTTPETVKRFFLAEPETKYVTAVDEWTMVTVPRTFQEMEHEAYRKTAWLNIVAYSYPVDLEAALYHHDRLLFLFDRAHAMSLARRGMVAPENIGTCELVLV